MRCRVLLGSPYITDDTGDKRHPPTITRATDRQLKILRGLANHVPRLLRIPLKAKQHTVEYQCRLALKLRAGIVRHLQSVFQTDFRLFKMAAQQSHIGKNIGANAEPDLVTDVLMDPVRFFQSPYCFGSVSQSEIQLAHSEQSPGNARLKSNGLGDFKLPLRR